MARYTLHVLQVFEDYEQLVETKRFNSLWLRKAYMRALLRRHEGDDFRGKLYERPFSA
ncbi:hypothetical protein [Labrys neptuniae]